ncbi:MAG: hypothetical protein JETT_2228 [Candidatus Jettenia ecosi]|uniref:Uncharacterized protein n=1 Tax=Candidatus Jettenia ecosi TaxID=2494326 RepID=A0A533QLS6_9BACT|nr:MAG: hypothetical protein JETT_2228 [Candidatus Jettenia ecosi]
MSETVHAHPCAIRLVHWLARFIWINHKEILTRIKEIAVLAFIVVAGSRLKLFRTAISNIQPRSTERLTIKATIPEPFGKDLNKEAPRR